MRLFGVQVYSEVGVVCTLESSLSSLLMVISWVPFYVCIVTIMIVQHLSSILYNT